MAGSLHAASAARVEELVSTSLNLQSPEARRLVALLVPKGGRPGPADRVAKSVGLRNRHQLTRLLARESLPSLNTLAAWVRILLWVVEWEQFQVPLAQASLRDGDDPAVRFRTIRRVAGCTWTELQHRGSVWAALEFRSRCGYRTPGPSKLGRSA